MFKHLRYHDWPLAAKLTMAILLAAMPLILVTLYNHSQTRAELLAAAQVESWQRAIGTAAILDAYLHERMADVQALAVWPVLHGLVKPPPDLLTLRQALMTVQRVYGFRTVCVTDVEGRVVASSDHRLVGQSLVADPAFCAATAGQVYAGEPQLSEGEVPVISFAAPIRSRDGRLLGTVIAQTALDFADSFVSRDTDFAGPGGYGMLWDSNGLILANGRQPELRFTSLEPQPPDVMFRTAEEHIGQQTEAPLGSPDEQAMLMKRSRMLLYDSKMDPFLRLHQADGKRVQATIVPLTKKRWLYGIFIPESNILAQEEVKTRSSLIVAGLAILAASGVGLLLAQQIAEPIRVAAVAARAIAAGRLDQRIGLGGCGEVNQLAAAFDEMAVALQQRTAELQAANQALREAHDELEIRVKERTAELARTNEELQLEVSEREKAQKALHSREAILEAVSFAAEQFLKSTDWEQNIQEVLARLGQAAGVSRVYIFQNRVAEDGALLSDQRYEWTAPEIRPEIDNPSLQGFPWLAGGFARWVEMMGRGEPVYGHVRELPESEQKMLVPQDIQSIVGVPIFVEGTWWGFIGFDECLAEREWSMPEIDALKAAAGILGAAIQRKQAEETLHRLLEETTRSRSRLLALSQAAQAVQRALSPDEIHRTVVDQVTRLGYNAAVLILTEDQTQLAVSYLGFEPALLRVAEELTGLRAQGYRFPLRPGGFFQRVIAGREPVFVEGTPEPTAEAMPEAIRPLADRLAALLGLEQRIAAPLVVSGEPYGLLIVSGKGLSEADIPAVTVFANQAAIAIENARLLDAVTKHRKELQKLSAQLISAQEAERKRVALELHDEIGQLLTGLKLILEMSSRWPPETVHDRLSEARAFLSELTARVHDMSLDLRPAMLDDLGLLPTLLWHFKRYTAQTNVQVTFRHTGLDGQRFPQELETAAYRIVQEALTNVARHAGVNEVTVRLWADQKILGIQVEDDGVGFDSEAVLTAGETSGLAGMRERVILLDGELMVESAPGSGTCVTAILPLKDNL